MLRTTFVTAALTTGLVLGSAGVASAHERFITKRSAAGTAGATHSANWPELTLADLFSDLPPFLPPPSQTQVQQAVDLAEAQGIPSSVALSGPQTIPVSQDGWSPKSGDGKGVDHFFSALRRPAHGHRHDRARQLMHRAVTAAMPATAPPAAAPPRRQSRATGTGRRRGSRDRPP
jgi:hypothetical protein